MAFDLFLESVLTAFVWIASASLIAFLNYYLIRIATRRHDVLHIDLIRKYGLLSIIIPVSQTSIVFWLKLRDAINADMFYPRYDILAKSFAANALLMVTINELFVKFGYKKNGQNPNSNRNAND